MPFIQNYQQRETKQQGFFDSNIILYIFDIFQIQLNLHIIKWGESIYMD